MAHETPTSGSSYPFYVAILGTCAVAITYYAGQSDLVSSRPALDSASMTEPHALFGMRSAFSRIWEDPFEFLALMDSAETGTPSPRRRDETHEQLASLAATGQLVVLPVLVAGGPYPEDAEERKRINYAVSSALFSMGYEMGYRERITSTKVDYRLTFASPDRQLTPIQHEVSTRVPLKLFRRAPSQAETTSTVPQRVLVLWINETLLGHWPFDALQSMLASLWPKVPAAKPGLRILGPHSSDALLLMYRELAESSPIAEDADRATRRVSIRAPHHLALLAERFQDVAIYSARATVPLENMLEVTPRKLHEAFASQGVKLVRTIGCDASLVHSLEAELLLRRAWPTPSNRRHVVLLTETDTLYGRSMSDLFRERISASSGADDRIHVFSYFRGIDGRSRTRPPVATGPPSPQSPLSIWEQALTPPSLGREPPEGPAQRDYLRRLGRQLLDLEDELRGKSDSIVPGSSPIGAIGVVGNDIYDKLLVLQALRPLFPGAEFFTTDLDARYASPYELRHTRNILVASHYALHLNQERIARAPLPFRDSYQTGVLVSVLLALGDSRVRIPVGAAGHRAFADDPWDLLGDPQATRGQRSEYAGRYLKPLLFEIGLQGPQQITRCPESDAANHLLQPPAYSERARIFTPRWWLRLALALMLVTFPAIALFRDTGWHGLRSWRPGLDSTVVAITAGPLVLLGLLGVVWLDQGPGGEPLAWFAGTSVWPSALLAGSACFLGAIGIHTASLARDARVALSSAVKPFPSSVRSELLETHRAAGFAFLTSMVLAVGMYAAYALLWNVWGSTPLLPARGGLCRSFSWLLMTLAESMVAVLAALVTLRLHESFRRIGVLRKWVAGPTKPREKVIGPTDIWDALKFVQSDSTLVVKYTWWPFVVAAILIVARAGIFDNWGYPLVLILYLGASLIAITIALWLLRRKAGKLKREAIDLLHALELTPQRGRATLGYRSLAQATRERVAALRDGAFRPWSDDPLLWTLALPFGSSAVPILQMFWR
jgi:hypothetical protein